MVTRFNRRYWDGWLAALEEMRRPGWQEEYEQTRRDIAAGRGRDLEVVVKEIWGRRRDGRRR